MKNVIWSGGGVVVFEDLSYIVAPEPRWKDREPTNRGKIERAQLAQRYGLPVSLPEPIYAVLDGHAVATLPEIEAAVATLRFVASRDCGPKIDDWQSDHPYGCACGCCPSEPVYSRTERELSPGWDITCPATWFVSPRRTQIEVMLPDGKRTFSLWLDGGSGSRLSPHCAEHFGAPDWIKERAGELDAELHTRWRASREAEDARLIAELRREFGLEE